MSITVERETASRILRRHTIVTTHGMAGVLSVAAELRGCGELVKELAVDVHEGVGCSELTCAVSMTAAEAETFAAGLRRHPDVESVHPY